MDGEHGSNLFFGKWRQGGLDTQMIVDCDRFLARASNSSNTAPFFSKDGASWRQNARVERTWVCFECCRNRILAMASSTSGEDAGNVK